MQRGSSSYRGGKSPAPIAVDDVSGAAPGAAAVAASQNSRGRATEKPQTHLPDIRRASKSPNARHVPVYVTRSKGPPSTSSPHGVPDSPGGPRSEASYRSQSPGANGGGWNKFNNPHRDPNKPKPAEASVSCDSLSSCAGGC